MTKLQNPVERCVTSEELISDVENIYTEKVANMSTSLTALYLLAMANPEFSNYFVDNSDNQAGLWHINALLASIDKYKPDSAE